MPTQNVDVTVRWQVYGMNPSAKEVLNEVTSVEYWSKTFDSAGIHLGIERDASMKVALGKLRSTDYKDRLGFICGELDEQCPWTSLKGMQDLLIKKLTQYRNIDTDEPGPSHVGRGESLSPSAVVRRVVNQ
jgi:hypothetical protein